MGRKVFVEVIALHRLDGSVRPLELIWEDGRKFAIDRILDVRQAASLKAGGMGICYTSRVSGRELRLFDDQGYWFLELD